MINVIGLGPGNIDYITKLGEKMIQNSDVVIGGKRNLESIKNFDGEKIEAVEALSVVGNITSVGDVLTLRASIKTKLKLNCSRCLEAFIYPIDIDIEEKHSLQNPYDEPLKILEVQKGDILDENDIVRFEDMYGRV